MVRRSEMLLRWAWDANAAVMAPALASACVARNVDSWLTRLSDHVARGTRSKEVINSLEIISKAVAYLADTAVETARTTAKSVALLNLARRVIWVKSWEGDHMSRCHHCRLPFKGFLLFGPGLDQVLSRSAEKGKKFPVKAKRDKDKMFFRGPTSLGQFKTKKDTNKRWGNGKIGRRAVSSFPSPKAPNESK